MTRALLIAFGRRRLILVGSLLLAVGAGAWAMRRTCGSCRGPRAAQEAIAPTLDDETARAWKEFDARALDAERAPRGKIEKRKKLEKAGAGWLPRCEERLVVARRELARHAPIFDDGVVEKRGHDHVRYAFGVSHGLSSCLQEAEFCEACASISTIQLATHGWSRAPKNEGAHISRCMAGRCAFLDLPEKRSLALARVFERVMKAAADDCLAMKDEAR